MKTNITRVIIKTIWFTDLYWFTEIRINVKHSIFELLVLDKQIQTVESHSTCRQREVKDVRTYAM